MPITRTPRSNSQRVASAVTAGPAGDVVGLAVEGVAAGAHQHDVERLERRGRRRRAAASKSATSTASPSALAGRVEHDAAGRRTTPAAARRSSARARRGSRVVVPGRVDVGELWVPSRRNSSTAQPSPSRSRSRAAPRTAARSAAAPCRVVGELDLGAQELGQLGRAVLDRSREVDQGHVVGAQPAVARFCAITWVVTSNQPSGAGGSSPPRGSSSATMRSREASTSRRAAARRRPPARRPP